MTAHAVVFGRVQRVQKVEETLNEFKRTRLVGRRMAGRTEWEIRRVEGECDCDCARCCVRQGRRVQKVEETLNEFKRTCLVARRMAVCTGWEIRRVGGEWDCDCARHCVWEGPEGSYS